MDGFASELERLNRPERFAQVAERHRKAFAWQPQGYIPMGIHVVNPDHSSGIDYRQWLNPEHFLEFQAKVLADTLAVGSDLLPVVGINHLGNAVIPTMFGARLLMPESGSTTLQEVGPEAYPVFADIRETVEMGPPALESGIVPEVEGFARYYRDHLPAWVHIIPPDLTGPFSTAMQLRGSGILTDMLDNPDVCHRFMGLCADLLVAVQQRLRRQLGASEASGQVTNFAILGPGLRLGEDSIVCLSPSMIQQFCAPAFARVNHLSHGQGHIHFCSLPHSRYPHVYPALTTMPEVAVVSSQFAFEYYAQHLADLRGRLAVESFYGGDAYAYVCDEYGSFRAWANDFVPRFKHQSGLVLYVQVSSIGEGQELWTIWQEAHRR